MKILLSLLAIIFTVAIFAFKTTPGKTAPKKSIKAPIEINTDFRNDISTAD